ncbi:uncharacterized protein SOCE836_014650 [Sorangium cellulosum]|uniref:YD repeat-containing protein n=1 Tax=Sorangium cellulosum TaxID=56 RepID=A0A4P2QHN6_SORCE|nr:uncharacterized protein SOCE836_014650 [Sorangium cellulosum]
MMLSSIYALGRATTWAYDALGRPRSRVDRDGAQRVTTTWTWDTAAHGIGKLHALASPDGEKTYAYTDRGQLDTLSLRIDGERAPLEAKLRYDELGRVEAITYPSPVGAAPFAVTYDHDAHGYGIAVPRQLHRRRPSFHPCTSGRGRDHGRARPSSLPSKRPELPQIDLNGALARPPPLQVRLHRLEIPVHGLLEAADEQPPERLHEPPHPGDLAIHPEQRPGALGLEDVAKAVFPAPRRALLPVDEEVQALAGLRRRDLEQLGRLLAEHLAGLSPHRALAGDVARELLHPHEIRHPVAEGVDVGREPEDVLGGRIESLFNGEPERHLVLLLGWPAHRAIVPEPLHPRQRARRARIAVPMRAARRRPTSAPGRARPGADVGDRGAQPFLPGGSSMPRSPVAPCIGRRSTIFRPASRPCACAAVRWLPA